LPDTEAATVLVESLFVAVVILCAGVMAYGILRLRRKERERAARLAREVEQPQRKFNDYGKEGPPRLGAK
jgi:hypothetical protein